ncbi:hypothetical protein HDV06_004380 [Boothiomyces sp. JEL0866]|nr:hypothetical protein HDV06_004380 [Boothiomyces sp. JEL0866]
MSVSIDSQTKANKVESLPRIDSANPSKPRTTKPLNDSPLKYSGSSSNLLKSDSQSNLAYTTSNMIPLRSKGSQANLLSKGSQSNLLKGANGSQSNLLKSSGSKYNLSDSQSNLSKGKGSQGNLLTQNAYQVEDDDSREELNTDELLNQLEKADDVLFDANSQFFSAQKAIYGSQAVLSKYSVLQGIKNEREDVKKDEDGSKQENDGEFLLFPSEMKKKLPTLIKSEEYKAARPKSISNLLALNILKEGK